MCQKLKCFYNSEKQYYQMTNVRFYLIMNEHETYLNSGFKNSILTEYRIRFHIVINAHTTTCWALSSTKFYPQFYEACVRQLSTSAPCLCASGSLRILTTNNWLAEEREPVAFCGSGHERLKEGNTLVLSIIWGSENAVIRGYFYLKVFLILNQLLYKYS